MRKLVREQRLLALFILHHRTQQKLSLTELARRSGIFCTTIGSIEREENSASFIVVYKILLGLGKSFTDLDMFMQECNFFSKAPCNNQEKVDGE